MQRAGGGVLLAIFPGPEHRLARQQVVVRAGEQLGQQRPSKVGAGALRLHRREDASSVAARAVSRKRCAGRDDQVSRLGAAASARGRAGARWSMKRSQAVAFLVAFVRRRAEDQRALERRRQARRARGTPLQLDARRRSAPRSSARSAVGRPRAFGSRDQAARTRHLRAGPRPTTRRGDDRLAPGGQQLRGGAPRRRRERPAGSVRPALGQQRLARRVRRALVEGGRLCCRATRAANSSPRMRRSIQPGDAQRLVGGLARRRVVVDSPQSQRDARAALQRRLEEAPHVVEADQRGAPVPGARRRRSPRLRSCGRRDRSQQRPSAARASGPDRLHDGGVAQARRLRHLRRPGPAPSGRAAASAGRDREGRGARGVGVARGRGPRGSSVAARRCPSRSVSISSSSTAEGSRRSPDSGSAIDVRQVQAIPRTPAALAEQPAITAGGASPRPRAPGRRIETPAADRPPGSALAQAQHEDHPERQRPSAGQRARRRRRCRRSARARAAQSGQRLLDQRQRSRSGERACPRDARRPGLPAPRTPAGAPPRRRSTAGTGRRRPARGRSGANRRSATGPPARSARPASSERASNASASASSRKSGATSAGR